MDSDYVKVFGEVWNRQKVMDIIVWYCPEITFMGRSEGEQMIEKIDNTRIAHRVSSLRNFKFHDLCRLSGAVVIKHKTTFPI